MKRLDGVRACQETLEMLDFYCVRYTLNTGDIWVDNDDYPYASHLMCGV